MFLTVHFLRTAFLKHGERFAILLVAIFAISLYFLNQTPAAFSEHISIVSPALSQSAGSNPAHVRTSVDAISFNNPQIQTPLPQIAAVSLTPNPSVSPSSTETPTPTVIPSTGTPTPTIHLTPTATPSPTISIPSTTPSLTPTPSPVPVDPNSDDIWNKIAECESHQNWSIDTGNGYFGGLQFSQGAWNSVGGSGSPASASRDEQISRAKQLQQMRGWGVWGACAKQLGLD